MRLIDADVLKSQICKTNHEWIEKGGLNGLNLPQQAMMLKVIEMVRNGFLEEIDNSPNVTQNWTPCEKGLPEMELVKEGAWYLKYRSQFVLAQTKREELFLCYCEKMEYKDKEQKDEICWYTFGTGGRKMRIKSKVVAWMLKPEPWKGETK